MSSKTSKLRRKTDKSRTKKYRYYYSKAPTNKYTRNTRKTRKTRRSRRSSRSSSRNSNKSRKYRYTYTADSRGHLHRRRVYKRNRSRKTNRNTSRKTKKAHKTRKYTYTIDSHGRVRRKKKHKYAYRKTISSRRSKKHRGKRQNIQHLNHIFLKSRTPKKIQDLSEKIQKDYYDKETEERLYNKIFNFEKNKSYTPTINRKLVPYVKNAQRTKLPDCNNELAFQMKEPLYVGIPGYVYGKSCFRYDSKDAMNYLLKNLQANKHIDVNKIVPPIQIDSNCWFNTMFVCLFISDKGRKFFHYFRQLMIEGKTRKGKRIEPQTLRDAFALLNFAIDASLTGNQFAYQMDTNNIIKYIYNSIPTSYKSKLPFLTGTGESGNPLRYYVSLLYYLNDYSIDILIVRIKSNEWKKEVKSQMRKMLKIPHVLIFEIYDEPTKSGDSGKINQKPISFYIKLDEENSIRYQLDSAVVRDVNRKHFCSTITAEKNEMAYDGASFNRIVPYKWKNLINSDVEWSFDGSRGKDGNPLNWNFMNGYQMLMYYRIQ